MAAIEDGRSNRGESYSNLSHRLVAQASALTVRKKVKSKSSRKSTLPKTTEETMDAILSLEESGKGKYAGPCSYVSSFRWPKDKPVGYAFREGFPAWLKATVRAAIREINAVGSGLQFEEVADVTKAVYSFDALPFINKEKPDEAPDLAINHSVPWKGTYLLGPGTMTVFNLKYEFSTRVMYFTYFDFKSVVLHEILHSAGFAHSDCEWSPMRERLPPFDNSTNSLTDAERLGLIEMYGRAKAPVPRSKRQ